MSLINHQSKAQFTAQFKAQLKSEAYELQRARDLWLYNGIIARGYTLSEVSGC